MSGAPAGADRPPCGRGAFPCLSSRASSASRGISNPEPRPFWLAEDFLGADHTKEFLSFEKQPSFFKGRNQSWFHPLRTPSRPGAAAPGPQRRAAISRWFLRIPSTGRAPPTASCSVLGYSFVIVLPFENNTGLCPRCHSGIPATQYNCHPERVKRAEGSPTFGRCHLRWQGLALGQTTRRNPCPLGDNLLFSKGETNRGFTL